MWYRPPLGEIFHQLLCQFQIKLVGEVTQAFLAYTLWAKSDDNHDYFR